MNIFLETPRLVLRQFTNDDADNLFDLDSDPEVMRFINAGNPTDYETIKTIILPRWLGYYQKYANYGIWAALAKHSQEFIGWFHFYPAIENTFAVELNLVNEDEIALGYRLKRNAWGQSYGTEVSQALVSKGFNDWGVKKVVAWALKENKASIRVMEKVGLKLEQEFTFTAAQLPQFEEWERLAVKYAVER